tara:strand:- start:148 stop:4464 length:4317 start_codon:yes stop_codon:yes gene_type:complete
MQDITVEPNVFYREKTIQDDIIIDSRYPDTFFGLGTSGTLSNGPNRTYYLAKEQVVTSADVPYGSIDDIRQMFLYTYANSVDVENEQTAPFFDVYALRKNISLTEGNLADATATVGAPIVYSSYYQFGTPWKVEDFDGQGKYFGKGPDSILAPSHDTRFGVLKIKKRDWMAFVSKLHETPGSDLSNEHRDPTNMLLNGIFNNKYANAGIDIVADSINMVAGTDIDTNPTIILRKYDNGFYRADESAAPLHFGEDIAQLSHYGTRADWIAAGAWSDAPMRAESNYAFNLFDENYMSKLSSDNSMFSYIQTSPDQRDIKDQTLEGAGNSEHFVAYSYANLEQNDSSTDGYVLHMKQFWENYSGATSGAVYADVANPFGRNADATGGSPYTMPAPQSTIACIAGIPRPNVQDVTKPGMDRLSFGPEIQIRMKIAKMPLATTQYTGSNYDTDRGVGLDRSFTIALTRRPPAPGVSFATWRDGTSAFDPCITFLYQQPEVTGNRRSTGMIDVIGVGAHDLYRNGGDSGQLCVSGNWTDIIASDYHTRIPFDTWFNLRIKLDMNTNASGGRVLAYFEGLTDSGSTEGKYSELKVATTTNIAKLWTENLTFFQTNMRAINEVTAINSTNYINNGYTLVDTYDNDDKEQSVYIDNISFYGWNTNTSNTTMCIENTPVSPIMIPSTPLVRGIEVSNSTVSLGDAISGANYFGHNETMTSSYLSFGFDSSGSVSGSYLFFNDFVAADDRDIKQIQFISGGYFTDTKYTLSGGKQGVFWDNMTVGSGAADNIRLGYYSNSVDRFTQKGSFYIQQDWVPDSASNLWRKTGNPLHAARVLTISDEGKTITVDKPEIFDVPYDTQFVAEVDSNRQGGYASYSKFKQGTGSVGYAAHSEDAGPSGRAMTQSKPRNGNTIYLTRSLYSDDANTDSYMRGNWAYATSGLTEASQILISPYKYWLNLAIVNTSGASYGHSFENLDATGNTTTFLQGRTYKSVLPTSNSGSTLGTTWNEYLFNDGIYANRHLIDFDNSDGTTIVDLSNDYGFGKPEDRTKNPNNLGYIRRDWLRAGHNYFDLSNYALTVNPKQGDVFNFIVKPSFPDYDTNLAEYSVNIRTGDNTANGAKLVYGIKDNVPVITDFEVNPVQNFLNDNVRMDIASENQASTDVLFTWEEKDKDIWYRLIWVDNKYITNKYHSLAFWAPLSGNTTTVKYKTDYSDSSSWVNLAGTNVPKLTGFQGYGSYFDGSLTISSSTEVTIADTDEMTAVVHLVPQLTGSSDMTAVCVSGASGEAMRIYINEDTKAVLAQLNNRAVTVSSSTYYACDSQEPLSVVLTYNKNLEANNLKLYVNSKLEDTADYTASMTTSGAVYFGGTPASSNYGGFIEECTFHTKMAYMAPNAKSCRISTSHLPDLNNGVSYNYNARMFAYDYHNIRGGNPNLVGTSNIAAWKVTGG